MFWNHNTTDASRRAAEAANRDCREIVRAAAVLGIREFDFFRLAYRRWFGEQPEPVYLERTFAAYMLCERIPHWVRQLSREVLDARRAGPLPGEAFGASRYRDRPTRHPRGPMYFSIVIVVWLAAFSLLLQTRYDPQTSGPPSLCEAAHRNPAFATWLQMITGKTADACREIRSG